MMRWMAKLERLLLVAGLLLLGISAGFVIYGRVLAQEDVDQFKRQQLLAQESNIDIDLAHQKPDFALWAPKRIQGYRQSLAIHFAPSNAVLVIPKIHLEVPVLEGTDDLSLNRGVGHIGGTAEPGDEGNIGIAGHRDGFFRGLKDVSVGDTVEIMTQKKTADYVIDGITIVDPSDVSVLARQSSSSLTLVTCYPFYFVGSAPKRYIVHASLAGARNIGASTSDNASLDRSKNTGNPKHP